MPANVHYVFASYNSTAVQWWRDVALLVQRLSSALTTLDPQVAAQWQSRLHIAAVPALELLGDLQQVLRGWHFPGAAAVDRFRRWHQVGSLYDWVSAQYQASLLGYTAQHFNFQVEQAAKLAHLGMWCVCVCVCVCVCAGGGGVVVVRARGFLAYDLRSPSDPRQARKLSARITSSPVPWLWCRCCQAGDAPRTPSSPLISASTYPRTTPQRSEPESRVASCMTCCLWTPSSTVNRCRATARHGTSLARMSSCVRHSHLCLQFMTCLVAVQALCVPIEQPTATQQRLLRGHTVGVGIPSLRWLGVGHLAFVRAAHVTTHLRAAQCDFHIRVSQLVLSSKAAVVMQPVLTRPFDNMACAANTVADDQVAVRGFGKARHPFWQRDTVVERRGI